MTRPPGGAWVISVALATIASAAGAETLAETPCRPVVCTSAPGAVLSVEGGVPVSLVDLDRSVCVAPLPALWIPAAAASVGPATSSARIDDAGIGIIAVAAVSLSIVVAVAAYLIRKNGNALELSRLALRDKRCSAARDVASHCEVILALLAVAASTEDENFPKARDALKTACENYRNAAPRT
jgi:hypothetical protein